MTRDEFAYFVNNNAPVILDGATGTNLMTAGMPIGVCPEAWILEHPDAILTLQKKYVEAGTKILYAPTFTGNRIKLAEYGLEDRLQEINTELIHLSKQAAEGRALVAADITMTGQQLFPLGDMQFEELVDVYKEQISAAAAAGADLIVVETMMSLQECRAALIASHEVCDLPVMITMTFNEDGRTLYGTPPESAVVTLQSLGADAIGVNCSTGPMEMIPLVSTMAQYATVPLIAKPNAGLPELVGRETIYRMTPEEFAEAGKCLVEAGAALVGGCCGTRPDHICALAEKVRGMEVRRPLPAHRRILSSERAFVEIGLDHNFMIVGERINPTGKKKLQAELRAGKLDLVREYALNQEKAGAAILDINMGTNGIDEKEMMMQSIYEVTSTVDCPLCIDTSYVEVMEAALRIYPGRALINSISLEKEKIEKLLPIAKKYGAMFILLPLSDAGIPADIEEKKRIISTVYEKALTLGMSHEDIIVDGLVATIGANPKAALECFETITYCKEERKLPTICGLSNISFGLPERGFVNAAFLTMAISKGLTMAIANPSQDLLTSAAFASDMLLNRPDSDLRYISYMSERGPSLLTRNPSPTVTASGNPSPTGTASGNPSPAGTASGNPSPTVTASGNPSPAGAAAGNPSGSGSRSGYPAPDSEKTDSVKTHPLYDAVMKGSKGTIVEEVKKCVAAGGTPGSIINDYLIPAINEVGELFNQKKYFLPQLISSANTMKLGIDYLEPLMERKESGADMPTIVFATVEGDIHDIGKNLVVLMLKNYGYQVIDMGKDVKCEDIVDKAMETGAAIIGLSALMTTTMMRMQDVIDLCREKGCTSKVIIGGACITPSFAEEIGADGYSKDAADCVKVVERLLKA